MFNSSIRLKISYISSSVSPKFPRLLKPFFSFSFTAPLKSIILLKAVENLEAKPPPLVVFEPPLEMLLLEPKAFPPPILLCPNCGPPFVPGVS